MSEFNKKKPYRKFLYSPLTLILLLVIFGVLLKALWGVYQKEKMSAEYLAREQNELQKLTDRQRELAKSVEYMKTEKGIEAEIRSKFRVAKEGELLAIIVDNDEKNNVKFSTTTTSNSFGFWEKLFRLFRP